MKSRFLYNSLIAVYIHFDYRNRFLCKCFFKFQIQWQSNTNNYDWKSTCFKWHFRKSKKSSTYTQYCKTVILKWYWTTIEKVLFCFKWYFRKKNTYMHPYIFVSYFNLLSAMFFFRTLLPTIFSHATSEKYLFSKNVRFCPPF